MTDNCKLSGLSNLKNLIDQYYGTFNLYWVGPRESDISMVDVFKGSITLFGSGEFNNYACGTSRYDHNGVSTRVDEFFLSEMRKISISDPNARFICYNPKYSFFMDSELLSKTLCLNDRSIIALLNDKIQLRQWLASFSDVPKYSVVDGHRINYEFLKKRMPGCDKFIIQKSEGSGGYGTFILTSDNKLDLGNERYLV